MLPDFKQRLKEAIALKFPSIRAFSEQTGIPYPSLRDYLSGKKRPGFDALTSIITATGVSADWLLTSTGEKEINNNQAELDGELLVQVVEAVEQVLADINAGLSARKKAWVVVMLYRTFCVQGSMDKATVREMVDLAR